jgi:cytidylate kinase
MGRVMGRNRPIIIAIDGPAASGKSTTAREVARRLGYTYIDSGAMYRAVTLKALRENIPMDNDEKVSTLAAAIHLEFKKNSSKTIIYMDGEDVSDKIRSPQIDRNISPVAANQHIRSIMVEKQREMGRDGGVVMDGRDIGTVVFPAAELKIFMKASVEERAQRRLKELEQKGIEMDFNKVVADIEYRDQQDTSRNFGPLKKADNAIEIDTTRLSIEEQIGKIMEIARRTIDC